MLGITPCLIGRAMDYERKNSPGFSEPEVQPALSDSEEAGGLGWFSASSTSARVMIAVSPSDTPGVLSASLNGVMSSGRFLSRYSPNSFDSSQPSISIRRRIGRAQARSRSNHF